MGRVFAFIRQFYTILLFIFLQIVSLTMLYNYSRSHRAFLSTTANEVTGGFNKQFYKVNDYMHLKEVNEQLVQQNKKLLQNQSYNYTPAGNTKKDFIDTLFFDTTGKAVTRLRYSWMDAKVVYNSLYKEKNYIQVARGANQGVRADMGLVSENGGVAGKLVEVSGNYATAMSMLHKDFNLQAKAPRSNATGWVKWDGKDNRYVYIEKVPKDVVFNRGDSIVTFGSEIFPDNVPIATIDTAYVQKGTNYLVVKARTVCNFGALSYAYIVENKDAKEQKEQLQKALLK
jgi:rod shape-determining protein MreC